MNKKKIVYLALFLAIPFLLHSKSASAYYDPNLLPDNIANSSDGINCSGRYSASGAYVSVQGNTKVINVRVPKGTPSVNLQLNFWTKLCNTSEYWKSVTYQGQPGSYSPLVSIGGSLRYGPAAGEWNLAPNLFTYTPPSGSFQTSGMYGIDYYWKAINSNRLFAPSGTRFACVGGGENTGSYNQFSQCGTVGYFQFQINVEVYDDNPVGYADSCELVGNTTRIWGWGYENDNAGGPTASLNVGGTVRQAIANEANYRVAPINSFLDLRSYGRDARDNNYGWHIDYTGLRRGSTYAMSGSLINSGAGSNQSLGINPATFPGNNVPANCLPSFDDYTCTVNVVALPSSDLYVQQIYSISLTLRNTGTTTWDNSFSVYNDAADNPATPYSEATHNNLNQNMSSIAPGASTVVSFSNLSSNVPLQINYNFKIRRSGGLPSGTTPFDINKPGCTGSVYIRYCPPGSTNSACGNTVSERGGYVCSIPSLTSIEAGVDTTIPISASYSGIRTSSAGTVSSMNVTATGVTRTAAGIPTGASRDTTVSRDTSPFNFPTSGDQSALGAVGFRVPTGIFGEPDYNGAANCGGAVRTGYKPYVKAYGGDVWAGAVFDIANSCQTGATNKGAIYAYANSPSPGKTEYTGASNQLGTTALMKIDGFYSGSTINPLSILGIAPKGQTFANNAASTYGGDFGGNGRCMIDYFNNTRDAKLSIANPSVATLSSLPAGSGRKQVILPTGNQNLGAITIQRGAQVAVYVDGDAYITSNIVYDTSARSSLDDIPSFSLVAKGNIYISSGVTRIDGLYIAQPRTNASNETTGKIFTCTNGSALYDAATLYTNCNSQLAVNGSLVAKQIKLLRLKNSLKDAAVREVPSFANGAGTNAAEVINYSPESFVGPSGLARPNSLGIEQRYDSIKSLPPVY